MLRSLVGSEMCIRDRSIGLSVVLLVCLSTRPRDPDLRAFRPRLAPWVEKLGETQPAENWVSCPSCPGPKSQHCFWLYNSNYEPRILLADSISTFLPVRQMVLAFSRRLVRNGNSSSHRASMTQRHPGRTRSNPRIRSSSIHLQLQTGDENVGPPRQHRTARCGNPNLGFVEPVPPGWDNVPSPDQKSFHTSTTPANRGQKRWSPGSISLGVDPRPGVRRGSTTRAR